MALRRRGCVGGKAIDVLVVGLAACEFFVYDGVARLIGERLWMVVIDRGCLTRWVRVFEVVGGGGCEWMLSLLPRPAVRGLGQVRSDEAERRRYELCIGLVYQHRNLDQGCSPHDS